MKNTQEEKKIIALSIIPLLLVIFTIMASLQALLLNPSIGFCALLSAFLILIASIMSLYHSFYAYKREGEGSYFIILSLFVLALLFRIFAIEELSSDYVTEYLHIFCLTVLIGLVTPLFLVRSMSFKIVLICSICIFVFMLGYVFLVLFALPDYSTARFPMSVFSFTFPFLILVLKHKRRAGIIRQEEEAENN